MTKRIDLREVEGVAVLRITRPPVNTLDHATLELLQAIFQDMAVSPPKHGLVLASSGGHFSAGLDLNVFRGGTDESRKAMALSINPMVIALYSLPFPTVAAIEGACLAGGLILALGCDARIAADEGVKIGLTEVTAGVPLGALEVSRADGEARRQILHERRVDGLEALRMGVVDAIAPASEIERRACEKARAMSRAIAHARVKAPAQALIETGLADGDPA